MRRGAWASQFTMIHHASVDGVIKSASLTALGIGDSTIVRNCRPGGPWQRILPGIVLLHNGVPTGRQRYVSAAMFAGDGAILTGHAGLALHGYSRWSSRSDVDVLVPHTRRPRSIAFACIERTRRPPVMVPRAGLAVAPVVRCATDAARRTTALDGCRSLLTEIVQRGDCSPEELAIELAECTSRGTALPRVVLAEIGDNAHSVAEISAQKLYARSGLPPMVFNRDIEDADGNFIARPDGWIDDVALAWEIDSLRHHLSVADHERTLLRRAVLQRHGIVVVAPLPKQLHSDSATVLADLHANYRIAQQRPRPAVRLTPESGDR